MKKIGKIIILVFAFLLLTVEISANASTSSNVKKKVDKVTEADLKVTKTVKSIKIYGKSTVTVGESTILETTVKSSRQNYIVKWTTSNKKVATVTKDGKVTGKKKGTVIIKAKVGKKTAKKTIKIIKDNGNNIAIKVTNVPSNYLNKVYNNSFMNLKLTNVPKGYNCTWDISKANVRKHSEYDNKITLITQKSSDNNIVVATCKKNQEKRIVNLIFNIINKKLITSSSCPSKFFKKSKYSSEYKESFWDAQTDVEYLGRNLTGGYTTRFVTKEYNKVLKEFREYGADELYDPILQKSYYLSPYCYQGVITDIEKNCDESYYEDLLNKNHKLSGIGEHSKISNVYCKCARGIFGNCTLRYDVYGTVSPKSGFAGMTYKSYLYTTGGFPKRVKVPIGAIRKKKKICPFGYKYEKGLCVLKIKEY